MLQQRWLVCQLAALLILRSVGILSTVFLSVYGSSVGRPTLAPNVLRAGEVFYFGLSMHCLVVKNIAIKLHKFQP